MRVGQVAADAGVGLVAGVAGTVAMTVSSTVEMRLRGRQASNAPADAAGKVFGVRPVDERAKAHVSQLVHCGYGIAWGAVRGILAGLGLPAAPATAVHGSLLCGTELIMLPALKIAPPVTEWSATEIAIDAWHHLVYVAATNTAYRLLDRDRFDVVAREMPVSAAACARGPVAAAVISRLWLSGAKGLLR